MWINLTKRLFAGDVVRMLKFQTQQFVAHSEICDIVTDRRTKPTRWRHN